MTAARYDRVAMALHWLMAFMILGLLAAGFWMHGAIKDPARRALAFEVYQLHKSLGLTVLVLSAVRIAWRLLHKPPPLPPMPPWQRLAAQAGHAGLYLLMFGLPLTGWLMVSASPLGFPTFWFGLVEVPHWPFAAEVKATFEGRFQKLHGLMGWGMVALLLAHVGAALFHQFIQRDGLLARMWPGPKGAGDDHA